ncbi:MAG TPA: 16S rRNA (adenine(1518)-N(6)/adenine(1519)-N(6))-dimethyltransferase RsmA [Candidatus Paceibacterota bacterium]|nr:16S rRNA (adenine(1518)-N(6)/adenine(1519)-N(6))-dimethyltransferase RsmA [Candidatus Paceibacterota bacterium]
MEKKKSLGQHFLTSSHYLSLIADTARLKEGERVLEIGPGDGALTRELLARGANVVAIEKDYRLIPVLQEKFTKEISAQKLILIEADALEHTEKKLKRPYIVVANIPYYITGAIIKKFLTSKNQPSKMVLLIQKEVAERIARSKKESLLSLSVKVYGEPRYVKSVPRGAFAPPPDVDSAILSIANISRNNFQSTTHEKKFFEIIHAGFAHKRKLLVRNLESIFDKKSSTALENAQIPKTARAEDVPLAQWLALSKT